MKKALGCVFAICMLSGTAAWGKIGGGEITFMMAGAKNVVYSHEFHTTKAKRGCSDCHFRLYRMAPGLVKVTMTDMGKGRSCGACHNGQQAFSIQENCARCHK